MTRSALQAIVFLALAAILTACGDVGDAPKAQTDTTAAEVEQTMQGAVFTIDTAQSSINWKAAKVTRAHDGGFAAFDGTVQVEDGQVSYVNITIDMTSIFTDTEKLTGHLKTDAFFLVEENPTAAFEASTIAPGEAPNQYSVTGNLTIRGRTNSVTFPATITVEGDRVAAKADFIINRQEWGISYTGAPDDLVNDDVRIIFDIVATADQEITAGL